MINAKLNRCIKKFCVMCFLEKWPWADIPSNIHQRMWNSWPYKVSERCQEKLRRSLVIFVRELWLFAKVVYTCTRKRFVSLLINFCHMIFTSPGFFFSFFYKKETNKSSHWTCNKIHTTFRKDYPDSYLEEVNGR